MDFSRRKWVRALEKKLGGMKPSGSGAYGDGFNDAVEQLRTWLTDTKRSQASKGCVEAAEKKKAKTAAVFNQRARLIQELWPKTNGNVRETTRQLREHGVPIKRDTVTTIARQLGLTIRSPGRPA